MLFYFRFLIDEVLLLFAEQLEDEPQDTYENAIRQNTNKPQSSTECKTTKKKYLSIQSQDESLPNKSQTQLSQNMGNSTPNLMRRPNARDAETNGSGECLNIHYNDDIFVDLTSRETPSTSSQHKSLANENQTPKSQNTEHSFSNLMHKQNARNVHFRWMIHFPRKCHYRIR